VELAKNFRVVLSFVGLYFGCDQPVWNTDEQEWQNGIGLDEGFAMAYAATRAFAAFSNGLEKSGSGVDMIDCDFIRLGPNRVEILYRWASNFGAIASMEVAEDELAREMCHALEAFILVFQTDPAIAASITQVKHPYNKHDCFKVEKW